MHQNYFAANRSQSYKSGIGQHSLHSALHTPEAELSLDAQSTGGQLTK